MPLDTRSIAVVPAKRTGQGSESSRISHNGQRLLGRYRSGAVFRYGACSTNTFGAPNRLSWFSPSEVVVVIYPSFPVTLLCKQALMPRCEKRAATCDSSGLPATHSVPELSYPGASTKRQSCVQSIHYRVLSERRKKQDLRMGNHWHCRIRCSQRLLSVQAAATWCQWFATNVPGSIQQHLLHLRRFLV